MKNYSDSAKKLLQKLSNPSPIGTLHQLQFAEKATRELSKRNYYEDHRLIFYAALFALGFSHALCAVSGVSFYEQLFAQKFEHSYLVWTLAGVCVVVIEAIKSISTTQFFRDFFALETARYQAINLPFLLISLLFVGLSVYASLQGGSAYIAQQLATQQTELKAQLEAEKNLLLLDKQHIIDRNTWQNKTWLPPKELDLLHQKEADIQALQVRQQQELDALGSESTQLENKVLIWLAIFDLLLIVSKLYIFVYKRNVALENQMDSTETPDHQVLQENIASQAPYVPQSPLPNSIRTHSRQIIGFKVPTKIVHENSKTKTVHETPTPDAQDTKTAIPEPKKETIVETKTENVIHEGTRVCEHCQKAYFHNHHKQRFCSNKCREQAWEKRTGRRLVLKKTEGEK